MSKLSFDFKFLFENIQEPAFIFLEKDKVRAANKSMADLFELEVDNFTELPLSDFLSNSEVKKLKKINEYIFDTGEEIEFNLELGDNIQNKVLKLRSFPHKNESGTVDYLLLLGEVIINSSDEKRIYRNQKRCEAVFEQAPLAFIVSDRCNKIIDWNKRAEEIFGWSKKEILDKNLNTVIPENDYAESTELRERIFEGYDVNSISKNIDKYGNKLYCEWNTALIKDQENNILEIVSIIKDLTKKIEAEEKINSQNEELKYNELRTQFFANISHELKTPLNLIFSSLQLVDFHFNHGDIIQKKDKIYGYLSSIKNNGYRLLRLVNNVIDVTRIDVESFNLSRGNFDIVKLCNAIVDSIEDYLGEKDRKFSFYSGIESSVIACDPFSVERVILNLISNSVKFTSSGDRIDFSLKKKEDNIVISVRDTGVGIAEKYQDIIFDQFRQVDQSFKRKSEGSGIGLYLVKSIVEMHGGKVIVESEYGNYTEFKVFLPDKTIDQQVVEKESYSPSNLLDKIEVEFSDIYNI